MFFFVCFVLVLDMPTLMFVWILTFVECYHLFVIVIIIIIISLSFVGEKDHSLIEQPGYIQWLK